MKVTTHLHIQPRLRMSGAIPVPIVIVPDVDWDKITFITDNYEYLTYPENDGRKLLGKIHKFVLCRKTNI